MAFWSGGKVVHLKAKSPWKRVEVPAMDEFADLIEFQELTDYEFLEKAEESSGKKKKKKQAKTVDAGEAADKKLVEKESQKSKKRKKKDNVESDEPTAKKTRQSPAEKKQSKLTENGTKAKKKKKTVGQEMKKNEFKQKESDGGKLDESCSQGDDGDGLQKTKRKRKRNRKKKQKVCEEREKEDGSEEDEEEEEETQAVDEEEGVELEEDEEEEEKLKNDDDDDEDDDEEVESGEEDSENEANSSDNEDEEDDDDEENEDDDDEDDDDSDSSSSDAAQPDDGRVTMEAWKDLGLASDLLKGLQKEGFSEPTPIQSLTLPHAILHRLDIVGAAQTGSGKTLAFGLPILQYILNNWDECENPEGPVALILEPTRELAMQVRHFSSDTAYHV
jgi:hypothetical protein